MSEQKNVVLLFNGVRQHSFSAKADCLVTLNPGTNVVSVSKFNMLTGQTGDDEQDKCQSESFLDMIESREITVIEGDAVKVAETSEEENTTGTHKPDSDKVELSITDIGAQDAIALVNAESSLEKVRAYLEAENAGETRKTVVKACEVCIELLEKAVDASAK